MAKLKPLLSTGTDGQFIFEWEEITTPDIRQGQNLPTFLIYNSPGAAVTFKGSVDRVTPPIPLPDGEVTESSIIVLRAPVPFLFIEVTGLASGRVDVYAYA